MTENDENDKKMRRSNLTKLKLVTFTGAAGLLGLAVSFAIFAFNSHKQKSKKKGTLPLSIYLPLAWIRISQCWREILDLGLPGCDTVCVNLSAKEILDLADEIISISTRVHDAVALVPLNKVNRNYLKKRDGYGNVSDLIDCWLCEMI